MNYEKLGYVALNVSDPERSASFYEAQVGLSRVRQGSGGEVYLRCSQDHHNLVLFPAASAGLKRLAFEMHRDADLEALASRVADQGIAVQEVDPAECAELRLGRTLRLSEPHTGVTLEFYSTIHQFGGRPYVPTVAKIQRLGHVVLKSPRWDASAAFYRDVLGFEVSDSIEGRACFLRCPPNPLHHSLAIAQGNEAGLHHINFMVSEIDDVGRALNRFRKQGVDIVFGPGRHPPSESIFLYFLDPDGLTAEYSFGMEEFPVVDARKPRVLPPTQDSVDYWGGERDPRHGSRGSIEHLDLRAGQRLPAVEQRGTMTRA